VVLSINFGSDSMNQGKEKDMKKILVLVVCMLFCLGCSGMANFTSKPESVQIEIAKTSISGTAPTTGKVPRTTFGNYPVKVQKEGYEPLYGILPLHGSAGVIILDIILFWPVVFGNAQGPFDYYEFDLEKGLIRYKKNEKDDWQEYTITNEEKAKAKQFFKK